MMVLVDGETNRASRKIDSTKQQCILFWCWTVVDKDSYAENDKNITSNVETGENRVVSVGENDNKYITHLGNRLVQQYTFNDAGESKQVIKSFVIGFSNVGKDHNSLKAIGEALNSRKFTQNNGEPFIIANDPKALEFAFESFASDIYDDLWMLMRPQLVN